MKGTPRRLLIATVTLGLALPATAALADTGRPRQALGVSAGVAGHSGLSYRHVMGRTSVQASALAVMLDQGDFFAGLAGVDVAYRLSVWRGDGLFFVPNSLAVRAVGGISGMWLKDDPSNRDDGTHITSPVRNDGQQQGVKTAATSTVKPDPWGYLLSASAGAGIEAGAIDRPGLSVTFDLRPTLVFSEEGFWGFLLLPFGSVMYAW